MFLKRLCVLAVLCLLIGGCTTKSYKSDQDIDRDMYSYAGDTKAKMGVRYLFGRGVAQDYQKAFKYFSDGANSGDKFAQNEVAYLYAAGKGTPKDYKKALFWYESAAKAGLASAQFNAGFMYLYGLGVRPNKEVAMRWVRKSASQGFEPAKLLLKSQA